MRDIAKLKWIKEIETNHYEMVLDHHMLSGWRMCQANFELLHVLGRKPKANFPWSLEFGILLHKMVQRIYDMRRNNGGFSLSELSQEAGELWDKYKMDKYSDHRTSKSLGGRIGFLSLVHQYAHYYNSDNERLRIIGTEVGFGQNHEVPLGSLMIQKSMTELFEIDCYLSGRIDFLADDGVKIGPVDHKTRANFGLQDLGAGYNPHEGMTGYIYATRKYLEHNHPALLTNHKVNSAWMNFIQVANEPDPLKRFKRVLVMRTDYQLEQYRLRQLQTFKEIFNYLQNASITLWNTEVCAHWYGQDCIYRTVHRQPDLQSQLIILNNDFEVDRFWNPEEPEEYDNKMPRDNSTNTTAVQEQSV